MKELTQIRHNSLLLLAFVMCSMLSNPSLAQRVVLQDGTVHTGAVSLTEDSVTIKGETIDKTQVKEIFFRFEEETVTQSQTSQPSGEIKEIIDEADAFASRWPDAGAVLLVDDGVYTYNPDGSWISRSHYRVKILKEEFKSRYSIGGTGFTEGRAKANLVLARTIKKDGRVVDLDPANIRITKPTTGGGTFVTVSTLMFTFPEVEVGDIVESIIEQETYNPAVKEFFFPVWLFQSSIPVSMSQVKIVLPETKQLYYHVTEMPDECAEPQEEEKEGLKTYTWRMDDLAPYIPEPMMPNVFDIVPSLRGAIFDDWAVIADWIQGYWGPNTTPSDKLKEFTLELTRDAPTVEDKVARIYHWVQKNIRYIIIKGDLASTFGSYPGEVTLERKFGCCVDKAVLLSGMLASIGVKSTPVVLNTVSGNTLHSRVPQISLQHAISCVYLGERKFYLDCTNYNYRYPYFTVGNHGVWCLNPLERRLEYIEPPPPKDNASMYRLSVDLDPNGDCRVVMWTNYTGSYEAGIRGYWKSVKESERPLHFANMVKSVAPTANLHKYHLSNLDDIAKPFSLSYSYRIDRYPTFAGDLVIMDLPDHHLSFGETGLNERIFPIRYYGTYQRGYTYIITIPENMRVFHLPDPLTFSSPHITYRASYRRISTRKILYNEVFKRFTDHVPAEDYQEFKQMCKKIENYTKNQIFLELTESKGGE